jgi:hypothetical protein
MKVKRKRARTAREASPQRHDIRVTHPRTSAAAAATLCVQLWSFEYFDKPCHMALRASPRSRARRAYFCPRHFTHLPGISHHAASLHPSCRRAGRPVLAGVRRLCTGPHRTAGLHRARSRPGAGLQGRVRKGKPEHRAEVRARLDRHRHRQAAGRKGQPAGRRGVGPGRHLADAAGQGRHAPALRAQGPGRHQAHHARSGQPAQVGRHGRVVVGHLLQHRRSHEEEPAQAHQLGRPRPTRSTRARSPCPTRRPRAPAT